MKRPSNVVDWAFAALDRGIPRATLIHLAALLDQLSQADADWNWDSSEESCRVIKAINTELGLPTSDDLIRRADIRPAFNEIFYRLTGINEPMEIEER